MRDLSRFCLVAGDAIVRERPRDRKGEKESQSEGRPAVNDATEPRRDHLRACACVRDTRRE